MKKTSRREFMGYSCASLAATGLTQLGLGNIAFAETSPLPINPYRATVCIFFKGGLDYLDTVIPYDPDSYKALRNRRSGIFSAYENKDASREREQLLPLNPINTAELEGREFAFTQDLLPLYEMFENQELSILSGIGPLIEPTSRVTFNNGSARTPKRLFSHNDQQSVWGSLDIEGTRFGWGGRLLDTLVPQDSPSAIFSSVATKDADAFLYGENTTPISYNGSMPDIPKLLQGAFIGHKNTQAQGLAEQFMRQTYSLEEDVYQHDIKNRLNRSLVIQDTLRGVLSDVPTITTIFPEDSLGQQLRAILELIALRSRIGIGHQIFYATIGGFDTHTNNVNRLPDLHQSFAPAMQAFKDGLKEIDEWNNVTTFTASDFGRTLVENGSGTDHAWASMQFIMGGAVKGKHIVGALPSIDVQADSFTDNRGRWIPEISVEQLGATLGQWMGANSADIEQIFPNLINFNHKTLDLFV
ncbi:MAG: DUF1501 domain-containing protein [Pseudomonadota bacterium]